MIGDRIASIVLLAFCAFFYYVSFGISTQNLTGLEASFFPRVLLGSIAALAILLLIRSFIIKKPVTVKKTEAGESGPEKKKWWQVWVIFTLFAVYIFFIDILGFTTSSFLFMTLVYFIAVPITIKENFKRHAISVAFLLLVSVALTFVFETLLQVYLPEGIFF